jgi:hypothetical protein
MLAKEESVSKTDAERLVYELKGNPQLRAEFRKAGSGDFEKIAHAAGFNCTKEEYAEEVKHAIVDRELASTLSVTAGVVSSAVSSVV